MRSSVSLGSVWRDILLLIVSGVFYVLPKGFHLIFQKK